MVSKRSQLVIYLVCECTMVGNKAKLKYVTPPQKPKIYGNANHVVYELSVKVFDGINLI